MKKGWMDLWVESKEVRRATSLDCALPTRGLKSEGHDPMVPFLSDIP